MIGVVIILMTDGTDDACKITLTGVSKLIQYRRQFSLFRRGGRVNQSITWGVFCVKSGDLCPPHPLPPFSPGFQMTSLHFRMNSSLFKNHIFKVSPDKYVVKKFVYKINSSISMGWISEIKWSPTNARDRQTFHIAVTFSWR